MPGPSASSISPIAGSRKIDARKAALAVAPSVQVGTAVRNSRNQWPSTTRRSKPRPRPPYASKNRWAADSSSSGRTLPVTAMTAGSPNGATSASSQPAGSTTSSSVHATMAPRAATESSVACVGQPLSGLVTRGRLPGTPSRRVWCDPTPDGCRPPRSPAAAASSAHGAPRGSRGAARGRSRVATTTDTARSSLRTAMLCGPGAIWAASNRWTMGMVQLCTATSRSRAALIACPWLSTSALATGTPAQRKNTRTCS